MSKLREARQRLALTQTELASLAGYSSKTISRLEANAHRPRMSTVRRLAEALQCEPNDLFEPSAYQLKVRAAADEVRVLGIAQMEAARRFEVDQADISRLLKYGHTRGDRA